MCKFYQLTNNHKPPENYPLTRVWVKSGQSILICGAELKFTVCELDTKQAIQLHTRIFDMQSKDLSGLMLRVDSFLDLTQYGFLASIRAAEWAGKNLPKRILIEFVSLKQNVSLSISR